MLHVKVVCGPMWGGKSSFLRIERNRALLARRKILCIKPLRDTRTKGKIATRELQSDGSTILSPQFDAIDVCTPEKLKVIFETHTFNFLIADECQFFPAGNPYGWFSQCILDLMIARRNDDLQIILAGLDLDTQFNTFGAMPELMGLAHEVIKMTGVCMKCGSMDGRFSYRKTDSKEQIVIGNDDIYEVRCLSCCFS